MNESLPSLATPVRFLKGVGPKRADDLEKSGISTVEDIIFYLPFRYEDWRAVQPIAQAALGARQTFVGRLEHLRKQFIPRRRAQTLSATLSDGTGSLTLAWFRAPGYLAQRLQNGIRLLVRGKVEPDNRAGKRIVHPEFDILDDDERETHDKILPIYIRPAGLPLSLLRKWIRMALSEYGMGLPDLLPPDIRERRRLLPLPAALAELHQPSGSSDMAALNSYSSAAHRSVIFEELFLLQLGLALRKQARSTGQAIRLHAPGAALTAAMRKLLPFRLTAAQERVVGEIENDMDGSRAMHRLIQGDVGSGKTMVAWLASLRAIEGGYQAAWMAPTELLAEQHFRAIAPYAEALGIRAGLLTGSQGTGERRALLAQLEQGTVQFLVGTHAVIQETVRLPRLALGVVDEQHRFGVMQRLALQRALSRNAEVIPGAPEPHVLLMSATPIPRSLAMVLYGDLDISVLDELPPGRTPVRTKVCYPKGRREIYETLLRELRQGHQAFIVYPLVEASEELTAVRDATQMAEKMRAGALNEFGIGLVHGKMSSEERDGVMRAFRDSAIGVLVSTTVVEVGIDVPNATVIVIEHAERFGLAQLHQLRGRVGRGKAPGYCLLINRAPNSAAAERLRVMEKEQDGFKIAEADLRLRGAGEFLGTRQSGVGEFRLANLIRDAAILAEARAEAELWLRRDPDLSSPESAPLRQALVHRWGQRLQLGGVG